MNLEDLLTKYWSQVTLVLALIAYFGQLRFNLRYKKLEIGYSLFQQNRITAVNNFYLNYAKVEFMWHQLSVWNILEHKLNSKEIDNIIWPPLNELKRSVLELKIYFSTEEHKSFQKILDNFLIVNSNLSENYFDPNLEKSIIQRANDFSASKETIIKENSLIIDKLSNLIKISFGEKTQAK